jgi:hypothetical protein
MITWNENIIKLIYDVRYITSMAILNVFEIMSNGLNRTFRGSDPIDYNDEVFDIDNGNVLYMIKGNGNSMITLFADALRHKTFGEGSR